MESYVKLTQLAYIILGASFFATVLYLFLKIRIICRHSDSLRESLPNLD